MRSKTNFRLRVIFLVGLVAIFHIVIIYFLNIRVEESTEIKKIFIVYSIPIILLYTTCKMSLRMNKYRCSLVWIVTSTLPSLIFLNFLNHLKENMNTVPGILDISYLKIDYDQIYLLFYFPSAFTIIQIMLMLGLWIMKITKG